MNEALTIRLARNILTNVPDSYSNEQLNDIGTRAVYWVPKFSGLLSDIFTHPNSLIPMTRGQLIDLVARLYQAEQNMKIAQSHIHAEMRVDLYIRSLKEKENETP